MKQVEFKIESMPNNEFRIAKISPVELLALSTTQMDLENFKQSVVVFNYALEHIETKIGEKWQVVKTPNREVYFPLGIDENLHALQDLVVYFMTEVVAKAFTKSSE